MTIGEIVNLMYCKKLRVNQFDGSGFVNHWEFDTGENGDIPFWLFDKVCTEIDVDNSTLILEFYEEEEQ